jgi:uncharacterized protein YycO
MATLRYAFRVGASGWVSRAIRFVTKSQQGISHVEVLFPDGRSFSSREPHGSGWAHIDYAADPDGWIFVDMVDVPNNFIENAREWCDSRVGRGYDWLGILRFYLVKCRVNDFDFCSETGGIIAHICGRFLEVDPALTSPQRLYDLLIADYRARRPQ